MPRTKNSNGVPPELRTLSVIRMGEPVTPTAINAVVGSGNYASKYISLLKKRGFVFTIQRQSKKVISYTLVGEPPNAEALRNAKPNPVFRLESKPKDLVDIYQKEKPNFIQLDAKDYFIDREFDNDNGETSMIVDHYLKMSHEDGY